MRFSQSSLAIFVLSVSGCAATSALPPVVIAECRLIAPDCAIVDSEVAYEHAAYAESLRDIRMSMFGAADEQIWEAARQRQKARMIARLPRYSAKISSEIMRVLICENAAKGVGSPENCA